MGREPVLIATSSASARWPVPVALGLVLLLASFGIESAVHSVHHLLDEGERQS
jgi:hypothetical protein